MIAGLTGFIKDTLDTKIILMTASGVWYEVFVNENISRQIDTTKEITIFTSMIVREQEMYLVGFLTLAEKKLFEILITAKGIGPKQGLKILGEFSGNELRMAIVSGDISSLSRVKGISAKKAEQLILDLQEKMKTSIDSSMLVTEFEPQDKIKTEVLLTMRALGYADHEIKKPLDKFFEQYDSSHKKTEQIVSDFLNALNSY